MGLLSEPPTNQPNKTIKSFWKVSGSCNVKKIVREIIFRDDIGCGISNCVTCIKSEYQASLDPGKVVLVLTTDVIVRQINSCENWIRNCIIPATVAHGVKRRSAYIYGRLKKLLVGTPPGGIIGGYYLFSNENVKDTYIEQLDGETANERDERAVCKVVSWYTRHRPDVKIVLLRNDKIPETLSGGSIDVDLDFLQMTIYDYAKTLDDSDCFESLAPLRIDDEYDKAADEHGVIRNAYYATHLTEEEMMLGKEEGKYHHGILHMYVGSYQHGYVSCGKLEFKVNGLNNLNRSIDGDYVCVEVISDEAEVDPELNNVTDVIESVGVESLDETLLDKHMEPDRCEFIKKECRIVGILKRNWREYCGTLLPLEHVDVSTINTSIERTFIPVDARIPFIIIETKKSKELENKRIAVVIDGWDRYSKRPCGHWVSIIGDVDDRDVESLVILKEHNVIVDDFKLESYRELPPTDWQIPPEEIGKRWDFRNDLIFSVDPPGCKDIDDALGYKKLPNGNLQFSVHIADVSHFVKPNSSLDSEASKRCTTVYLVDRRTDMLPQLLTTNLCSLVPNEDRLTFSVVWEMTESGNIIHTKFTKGVIKSHKAFTYKEAYDLIEESKGSGDGNSHSVTSGREPLGSKVIREFNILAHSSFNNLFYSDDITRSLNAMNRMAKILREKRFMRGAVELESSDVKFEFDPTKVINLESYKLYDTNYMIEEFMLLANISVATKIHQQYPKNTLLRHHPPPVVEKLNQLKHVLNAHNVDYFNYGSSKELNASLKHISDSKDHKFASAIRILTTRCMSKALYSNSSDMLEEEFKHYGLCTDLYTHFTSPIRRFADVIVHRLLASALGLEPLDPNILKNLTTQCDELNRKHSNAQWCGRISSKMFAYLYFKEHVRFSTITETRLFTTTCIIFRNLQKLIASLKCYPGVYGSKETSARDELAFIPRALSNGPRESDAVVLDIMDGKVVLLSYKYGIEAVTSVEYSEFCEKTHRITLLNGRSLRVFDRVNIRIYSDNKHFRNSIKAEII